MKHPLLLASAAANLALLAVLACQPALAPRAVRAAVQRYFPAVASSTVITDTRLPPAPTFTAPKDKLWSRLNPAENDLHTLRDRLLAAGFPKSVVVDILQAELSLRYDGRMLALKTADPTVPFWQQTDRSPLEDPKRREELIALQQERSRLTRELMKDLDPSLTSASPPSWAANLPPDKLALVRAIQDDYAEMAATIRISAATLMLPEDREKLALLEREKRADLAAVLTPEQYADYDLRTSPLTTALGNRFNNFQPTDAEFRALFDIYKTLGDKYAGGVASVSLADRQALPGQVADQLRGALGEAHYGDFVRETNLEFQQLTRITQQEKLPPSAAVATFALRDQAGREANRIFDDSTLSVDQKYAALQQLAQGTRSQIRATLGPVAGPAYETAAAASAWLTSLERGAVPTFSKDPPVLIVNGNGTSNIGNPVATYRRLPPQPRP